MENESMEIDASIEDSTESSADVSADVSPDAPDVLENQKDSEAVQAPADSVGSGDVQSEETETADGIPAILEESEAVYDSSDLIALLEVQHAETVAYMQNVQTLTLVGVVVFGVLVGCLVVNTIAGFFHNL